MRGEKPTLSALVKLDDTSWDHWLEFQFVAVVNVRPVPGLRDTEVTLGIQSLVCLGHHGHSGEVIPRGGDTQWR